MISILESTSLTNLDDAFIQIKKSEWVRLAHPFGGGHVSHIMEEKEYIFLVMLQARESTIGFRLYFLSYLMTKHITEWIPYAILITNLDNGCMQGP